MTKQDYMMIIISTNEAKVPKLKKSAQAKHRLRPCGLSFSVIQSPNVTLHLWFWP